MSFMHRNEDEKAIKEFLKAAKKGYLEAIYKFGCICTETQNYTEAVEWLKIASDKSHSKAQTKLGTLYIHGRGVKQNFPKAMVLFQRAASNNEKEAIMNIAIMHLKGLGIDKNVARAIELLEDSAEKGSANPQIS